MLLKDFLGGEELRREHAEMWAGSCQAEADGEASHFLKLRAMPECS